MPFSPSSHLIVVFFFPVGNLSSSRHHLTFSTGLVRCWSFLWQNKILHPKIPVQNVVSCTEGKISVIINWFLLPFSPSSHLLVMFFHPVGVSSLSRHLLTFPTSLVGCSSFFWQKKLLHAKIPVENFVIKTKGLQERKSRNIEWDNGGKGQK